MAWKPEFLVQGKWYDNAVRFATKEECDGNAHAKLLSWTQPTACRSTECNDPVNYRWVSGSLVAVETEANK